MTHYLTYCLNLAQPHIFSLPLMRLHSLWRINLKRLARNVAPIHAQGSSTTLLITLHHSAFRIGVCILIKLLEKIIWLSSLFILIVSNRIPVLWAFDRGGRISRWFFVFKD